MLYVRWGSLLTSGFSLAYDDLAVVAWKDWRNDNHAVQIDRDGESLLPPPKDVRGVRVVLIDNEGNGHQYWIYTRNKLHTWTEWYVLVIANASDHGIELAGAPE